MHVIIIGGGKMGVTLAEELSKEKHDIVLIESDKEKSEKIAKKLNCQVLLGDGTDMKILEEANLKNADFVAALTSREELNLIICLMVKNIRPCKTAARLKNSEYENIFKNLGVDIVVLPEVAAADFLEGVITKPEVADLSFISRGKVSVLEFVVEEKSKAIGKKISELEKPKGSLVIGIYENNSLIIPDINKEIKEGDRIFAVAKAEEADKIRKMFNP